MISESSRHVRGEAPNALSALWAENAKLRAEVEHKKELVGQQAKELERRDKLVRRPPFR